MARPAVVAQTEIYSTLAYDAGQYLDVPIPFHQADDIIVLVIDYYPSPNTASAVPEMAGWTRELATFGNSSSIAWFWRRAIDGSTATPRIYRPDPGGAADSRTHLSGSIFVVRGAITYGNPFEDISVIGVIGTGSSASQPFPAVTSTTAGSLAIGFITATHYGVNPVAPSIGGYVTLGIKYSYFGAGAAVVVSTRPVEVETIPEGGSGYSISDPAGDTLNGGRLIAMVVIPSAEVGVGVIPVTSVPIRGMGPRSKQQPVLGCASEYEVIITGNDYETRIDSVRWSSLKWERVLDDISTAEVEIPDQYGGVACCAKYGGLVPWRYGITIERDGVTVWRGPVTQVARRGGAITVSAADAFVRFKRRLATRTESLRYINNDAGQMFADICNTRARVPSDAWEFAVPQPDTGVSLTRTVVAREFSMAWDILEDLLDSSIDMTVIAGCPCVFQPGVGWVFVGALGEQYWLNTEQAFGVTSGGDTVYGLFTQESFEEIPTWSINGMLQANNGWVAGADSGTGGFRKFWSASIDDDLLYDSVLDYVETAQLYRADEGEEVVDESAFQRRADSLVALRAKAPAVIDSVSLSATAPLNVDNLRPGSIWAMDVYDACWGQLLQASRLKRISATVEADAANEKISATLQPLGFSEGDI